MLQREHSAILSTFILLPFVIQICVFSVFEGLLKTGFTVLAYTKYGHSKDISGMGPCHFMKKLRVIRVILILFLAGPHT